MRMFSWFHNRRNNGCRQVSKKPDMVFSAYEKEEAACKEEFIDWAWPHHHHHDAHGLLTIGTIGNTNLKEIAEKITSLEENPHPSRQAFTPEEEEEEEEEKLQTQLDLLLNEDIHTVVVEGHVQRSTSVVYNRGGGGGGGSAISKKTLSFLLKKLFACRSTGIAPSPPTLLDPISESRMEKMVRAILHKKIYPQSCSSSTAMSARNKYLENRHNPNSSAANEDDENDKGENGSTSKWVKTDSEYIVLEI